MKAKRKLAVAPEPKIIRLDLGCGKNPKAGFTGVDVRDFGQDITADLRRPWPWKDGTVTEVNCSHFVEHLTAPERIHFVNELYRVLMPGARDGGGRPLVGFATLATPHWASMRAYGDLTHQWPPVSEMWFYYLSKAWRESQAPHNDCYTCDFDATWGYALHQELIGRNEEYQRHALAFWKESAQDLIATLVKK